jgi:predicted nucleic acid-binding protein
LEIVRVEWASVRAIPDVDAGEAAAILLAEQQGEETFLLMDDAKGRREAANRGGLAREPLACCEPVPRRVFCV